MIKPKEIVIQLKNLRIIYDVDGVQANFGPHFLDYFNIKDKSQATDWDDPRFKNNIHLADNLNEFWLGIPPLIDYERLKTTPNYFEPFGHLTSRNLDYEITSQYLKSINAPSYNNVGTVGYGESKVDVLKEWNADLIIDDSFDNWIEINNSNIKCECVLATRKHNEKYDVHNRVENLYDFYERFLPQWIYKKQKGLPTLYEAYLIKKEKKPYQPKLFD